MKLGVDMRVVDYDKWRMEHVLEEEADLRRRFGVGSKVGGGMESPRPREGEMGGREARVTMSGLRAKMSVTDWHTAPELIKLFGIGGHLPGATLANTVRGCAYALVQAKIAEVRQRAPGSSGGRPAVEFKLNASSASLALPTPGEMTTKEAREFRPKVALKEKYAPMSRRITRRPAVPVAPAAPKKQMPVPVRGAGSSESSGVWELDIDCTPICVQVPVSELLSFDDVEAMYQKVKKVRNTLFGLDQKAFLFKLVLAKK